MAKQRNRPGLNLLIAILLPGGIIAAIIYFLLKKKTDDKGTHSYTAGETVLGGAVPTSDTGIDLTRIAQEAFKQISTAVATAAKPPVKKAEPTTFVDDAQAFLGGLIKSGKDLPVVGTFVSAIDGLGQLPGVKQIGDFIGDLINPDIKTTAEQLEAATTPGTPEYDKFQLDMEAARKVRIAEMEREAAERALIYAKEPSQLESQLVQVAPGGKIVLVSNAVPVGDIPGSGSLSLGSQTTTNRYNLKSPILS